MADLEHEARRLISNSLSSNTWSTYETALNALHNFRTAYKLNQVWPVPIDQLSLFIAHMSLKQFSVNTARTYISALSSVHKFKGIQDCTNHFIIQKMLSGMSKTNSPRDTRQPITFNLLHIIIANLPNVCLSTYETCLFSAVFQVAFFGFFRVGELVETKSGRPGIMKSDVTLLKDPGRVNFNLRHSKGDRSRHGVLVTLTALPNHRLCPVRAMEHYFTIRPVEPHAAFVHFDHTNLTRYQFQAVLKKTLVYSGLPSDNFKSHSFRIGAATSAALNGVDAEIIQKLGRWGSNCYLSYIRFS